MVQSICQTDNIEDLKTDDIKRKAILAWEQRSPVQNNNNRPQKPQAAKKISAVQHSGPPHRSNNNSSNLSKRSSIKGTRTPNEEVGEADVEVVEELLGEHALAKTNKTSNNRLQGLLKSVPHLLLLLLFLARSLPPSSSLIFLAQSIQTSPTPFAWPIVSASSPPSRRSKGSKLLKGLGRNKGH